MCANFVYFCTFVLSSFSVALSFLPPCRGTLQKDYRISESHRVLRILAYCCVILKTLKATVSFAVGSTHLYPVTQTVGLYCILLPLPFVRNEHKIPALKLTL